MKRKMKARIATVTFNPAIDETVRIEGFAAGKVNRVMSRERHAGGKGVNVATFVSDYGFETTATGFLGDVNDTVFKNHFKRKGIADEFVRIAGETRTGIKIIDTLSTATTDINYPGIIPDLGEIIRLGGVMTGLAAAHDLFVISGSVPAGTDPSIYREAVSIVKAKGKKVIVDTSGEAFRFALEAHPDIIKPNIHELEEVAGRRFATMGELISFCREYIAGGVSIVAVSMGADGALFVSGDEALFAVAQQSRVVSTVGAGDAMVAGIAAGVLSGKSLAATAALATAFSLIAISNVELGISDPGKLPDLAQTVSIHTLNNKEELWLKSLR
jgi:1-phosphofructokinase